MSFSRFAAIGVALVAGVTLASCVSSSTPLPASGPFGQPVGFAAARVRFVQGSPNTNLGITVVDLYIDGHLAGQAIPYGAITKFIYSLPAGAHDFKLVQAGTLNPVFLEMVFKLSAGTKYAVVAEGDAAAHTTSLVLFTEPKYNTPSGSFAASFFNASPRASTATMSYNCLVGGPPCLNGIGSNSILFHSVNDGWCFAAYAGGALVPGPTALPPGTDPQAGLCASVFLVPTTTAPTNNMDFFLIDDTTAAQSRLIFSTNEQNG